MTCPLCGKTFNPRRYNQIFCSRCANAPTELKEQAKAQWFAREWAKWRRDFARGKTASNLKEDSHGD